MGLSGTFFVADDFNAGSFDAGLGNGAGCVRCHFWRAHRRSLSVSGRTAGSVVRTELD